MKWFRTLENPDRRGTDMGPLALKLDERFTSADYVTWDGDEQWELIRGVPYDMKETSLYEQN